MSHTNNTTNYNLPQFVTTDKPAWLTDINGAFSDIDAAVYAAQSKADTAYADAGTAQGDATAALTNAATADAKGAGAVASIEAAFDPTTIYAVGAKVMYNSLLYRCTVAVVTPGPWTGAANWERITVDSLIPMSAEDLPIEPGSAVNVKDAVAGKADMEYYYHSDVIGGQTISFWFRAIGPMAFIEIGGNSTTFPTTWTSITTLPAEFRPNTDRIVPIITMDGNRIIVWISTNGAMRIYASTGAAFQPNGTTAYVLN